MKGKDKILQSLVIGKTYSLHTKEYKVIFRNCELIACGDAQEDVDYIFRDIGSKKHSIPQSILIDSILTIEKDITKDFYRICFQITLMGCRPVQYTAAISEPYGAFIKRNQSKDQSITVQMVQPCTKDEYLLYKRFNPKLGCYANILKEDRGNYREEKGDEYAD